MSILKKEYEEAIKLVKGYVEAELNIINSLPDCIKKQLNMDLIRKHSENNLHHIDIIYKNYGISE